MLHTGRLKWNKTASRIKKIDRRKVNSKYLGLYTKQKDRKIIGLLFHVRNK
jgi:hypothetical protein